MNRTTVDAVVIGSGPNGLVAANALVDAGWEVLVLEAQDTIGGAVRSAEVTAPGFSTDLFSAFYPLAAASPVIRDLDLEQHGLRWSTAPTALAHVLGDGRSAVLSTTLEATMASLDEFSPGDGEQWAAMFAQWQRIRDPLLDALFTPFPPIRSALRLLTRLRTAGTVDLARLAVLPVRRLAAENFRGEGAGLLLTGNAMHSDIPPDAAGSGVFGWILSMLAQDVGFPVPQGGAGNLPRALASRLAGGGGQLRTGSPVTSVLISGGRATGVRCADGSVVTARKAVLADVGAPSLYRDLVGLDRLPAEVGRLLTRFSWDHATLKVNWALDRPIGLARRRRARAGTVHLGVDSDGFVDFAADLSVGRLPRQPFALLGQMTTADPSRSPAGTESAWAYTHVPAGLEWNSDAAAEQVDRVRDSVEQLAPGFTASIIASNIQTPADLEAANANLVGGAINGGSAAIHQQLFFRPIPGTGRPETPIRGLYLASASATRAAACTAPAAGTRLAPRWPPTVPAAPSAEDSTGPRGTAC